MKYLTHHNKLHIYPPCFVLTHCLLVTVKCTVHPSKTLHFPVFLVVFLHLLHQLHSLKPFWFGWIFLQLLLLATALGPSSFSHSYLILMGAVSTQPKNMPLFLLFGFPDEEEVLPFLLRVTSNTLKIQLNGGRMVLWRMVWHCSGVNLCVGVWTGMAKVLGQNQFVGPIMCFKSKVALQGSSSDQADLQEAPSISTSNFFSIALVRTM